LQLTQHEGATLLVLKLGSFVYLSEHVLGSHLTNFLCC